MRGCQSLSHWNYFEQGSRKDPIVINPEQRAKCQNNEQDLCPRQTAGVLENSCFWEAVCKPFCFGLCIPFWHMFTTRVGLFLVCFWNLRILKETIFKSRGIEKYSNRRQYNIIYVLTPIWYTHTHIYGLFKYKYTVEVLFEWNLRAGKLILQWSFAGKCTLVYDLYVIFSLQNRVCVVHSSKYLYIENT